MGGVAASTGPEHQAAVAAYVAVRMLLERPLNWSPLSDDIPLAICGEVGGPGDDLRIEFGTVRTPLETQCKRSLSGRSAVATTITDMVTKLQRVPRTHEIVLVVGPGSSSDVRDVFASDVRNYRNGRRDGLRATITHVLTTVDRASDVLSRLYVVPLDVDVESAAGAQVALDGLRQALEDPAQAETAWEILIREGIALAKKGRLDREGVVKLLTSRHKLKLKPVGRDAGILEQIAYARKLHADFRSRTAAGLIEHLRGEIDGKVVAADVRRQLYAVGGSTALLLGEIDKARDQFARALDYIVAPDPATSPVPTEQLKTWLDAQYNYGLLVHVHGDSAGAEAIARRILSFDDRHIFAWSLLALTLETRGAQLEPPPPDLAGSPEYRDALAKVAGRRGNWAEAARALAPILATGDRNPFRLTEYAQALINASTEVSDNADRLKVLGECERCADEAVRRLQNSELDREHGRALFVRGRAREALGRSTEAVSDYESAASMSPTDPNVLIRAASIRQDRGDLIGALQLLTDEVVDATVVLRVLRAELRSESKDVEGAVRDLTEALAELPSEASSNTSSSFLNIATVAIDIGRLDLAEKAVSALTLGGYSENGPHVGVIRGRIAAERGDWPAAVTEYVAASTRAPESDVKTILGELASRFSTAGDHRRAIEFYERAGSRDPSSPFFRSFVGSLMQAEAFDTVASLLSECERNAGDRGETVDVLPPILLDAAIDIAWRQQDLVEATRFLEARMRQEKAAGRALSASLALSAAYGHAKLGSSDRSSELVNAVIAADEADPEDLMRAANVLVELSSYQRAIDLAFRAVRSRPTEKRMIANFIQIVLSPAMRHQELANAPAEQEKVSGSGHTVFPGDDDEDEDLGSDGREGTVTAESFVRVVSDDGQRYDFFIYRQPPTDSRLDEYLEPDEAVADLIGKKVGDTVVRNRGTWNEQRFRITRIMPAVVVVFRRYMRTFALRFPEEPLFRSFKVGKKPTLDTLAPILAAVHMSAMHDSELLARYDQAPLPLGVLAKGLNKHVIDIAMRLASDSSRRLYTDAPPFTDYTASVELAAGAGLVILTRPAIEFVAELGALDLFISKYELIAPQSMMEEWEQEIGELQRTTAQGRMFLSESGGRPAIDEIPVGAAEPLLRRSQALYEKVRGAATILPRPVSALTRKDEKWRGLLGAPSFDAAALARSENGVLFADDLGLRAIAAKEYDAPSFCTSALIDALHADGSLRDADFEGRTVQLIERNHDIVPIRSSTIVAAFGTAGTSGATARRVLDRLADPRVTLATAAVVAVGALRGLATAKLATTSIGDASSQVIESLVRHREPADVIPVFRSLLEQAFHLLPNERKIVEQELQRIHLQKRILRFPETP